MGSRRTRRRELARRRRGESIPRGLANVPAYVEIEMKLKCRRCGNSYEAEEGFYKKCDTPSGYQRECKACRKEIKEAERIKKRGESAQVPKMEDSKPPKEVPKNGHRKERDIKAERRRKMLKAAGENIAAGELMAQTSRSMTFILSLIVEQQLRLFYGAKVTSPISKPRMDQILEDGLFEFKQALSRIGSRMQPVIETGSGLPPMMDTIQRLQERAEAMATLGVDKDASQEEIKKAYRRLAMEAHPDHRGQTEDMQKINKAYALLVEANNG